VAHAVHVDRLGNQIDQHDYVRQKEPVGARELAKKPGKLVEIVGLLPEVRLDPVLDVNRDHCVRKLAQVALEGARDGVGVEIAGVDERQVEIRTSVELPAEAPKVTAATADAEDALLQASNRSKVLDAADGDSRQALAAPAVVLVLAHALLVGVENAPRTPCLP
jgi:hypothetical protein